MSFIRRETAHQHGFRINTLPGGRRNLESFWPDVTCFNSNGYILYEREIRAAPHDISKILEPHDFKQWHGVMSMHVSTLDKINFDDGQSYANPKAGTILFPRDIEKLRNDEIVIAQDVRDAYYVEYIAYWAEDGGVYKVYAEIFD